MKRAIKTGIVFVITIVVIIAVFWFVLPMFGVAAYFGNSYFVVSIIGSIVLSIVVSGMLNKLLFGRG